MNTMNAVRAGYGLGQMTGQWPGTDTSAGRWLTRIVGVRNVVQAGLSTYAPTAPVLALGVEVDLLHALSMVGLAVVRRPARRAAFGQVAVALGFAAAGAVCSRRAAQQPSATTPPLPRDGVLWTWDEWAQSLAERLLSRQLAHLDETGAAHTAHQIAGVLFQDRRESR